ncbi:MAG: IS30 family transposase [Pirellulaceae bacterium]
MPYRHLTADEREVISQMHFAGYSAAAIGRQLGRHRGTVSRELNRNGEQYDDHAPVRYNAFWAHRKSRVRRQESRRQLPRQLRTRHRLLSYVKEKLRKKWSPEQIAGRLRIDFRRDHRMRISHQSIYAWIWQDKAAGGSFYKHLRWSRKKRRKKYGSQLHKLKIRDRVSIRYRPQAVEQRSRYGDWEGDTMQGNDRRGFLLTQVERKSGYVVIRKLSDCNSAQVNRASIDSLNRIPQRYLKTMTFDNGTEFYRFKTIEHRTGLKIYFAQPYCSWQRGTNENTNGLIRQFFDKRQPLTTVTHQAVARAQQMLNNRPRKRLNFRTPAEVRRITD